MISMREFGVLSSGETVHLFHIENIEGEYVDLLDCGAAIQAICVKDRNGKIDDIVLGAPEGSDPTVCHVLGSTIGRCANRIAHGRYEVDGKVYQLEQNSNGHFLHGASGNYARKMFVPVLDEKSNAVTFSYEDHGEGGFDCIVRVEVSYVFGDDSVLTMTTRMTPEGTTVLNPTNHAYFNLGVSDIRNLHLTLRADYRVSRDEDGLPDGGRIAVQGTPADFTSERTILDAMEHDSSGYFTAPTPGYDEFYILNRDPALPAAELYSPENGRVMQIETDMPSMVLFAIDRSKPEPGKYGQKYSGYCAVCLEPGFVPNAVNCPQYDSPVFHAGEELYTVTKYIFKTDCLEPN